MMAVVPLLQRVLGSWRFGMQVAVSAAGMALGTGMLLTGRGDPAVYLPIVTSIIGYWLPAPRPESVVAPASEAHSSIGSVGRGSPAADSRPSTPSQHHANRAEQQQQQQQRKSD